jgi:phenylpyruvate tautomerase PptA (4-oxalocrotonate tautomerase family)
MPLLQLKTSAEVSEDQKNQLLSELSGAVASVTGKPESYVMVTVQAADISMAGSPGPAAFLDIRGIGGMDPSTNKALSAKVCEVLAGALNLPGDRVYMNFTDIPASNWGWNGSTF